MRSLLKDTVPGDLIKINVRRFQLTLLLTTQVLLQVSTRHAVEMEYLSAKIPAAELSY